MFVYIKAFWEIEFIKRIYAVAGIKRLKDWLPAPTPVPLSSALAFVACD